MPMVTRSVSAVSAFSCGSLTRMNASYWAEVIALTFAAEQVTSVYTAEPRAAATRWP